MNAATEWQRSWITAETASHDTIAVKKIYIDINEGNLTDGVLFSQIMYWHMPSKQGESKMQVLREGKLWLAKTYDDWYEECRIKSRTAREALRRIEKRGLIITHTWKFDGSPTKHIRINWEKFEEIVKSISHVVSNGNDILCQNQVTENVKSLTKTTTKTTTKKEKEPSLSESKPKPVSKPEPTPDAPKRPVFTPRPPKGKTVLELKEDQWSYAQRCNDLFYMWVDTCVKHGKEDAGDYDQLWRENMTIITGLAFNQLEPETLRQFLEAKYKEQFYANHTAPMAWATIRKHINGFKAKASKPKSKFNEIMPPDDWYNPAETINNYRSAPNPNVVPTKDKAS